MATPQLSPRTSGRGAAVSRLGGLMAVITLLAAVGISIGSVLISPASAKEVSDGIVTSASLSGDSLDDNDTTLQLSMNLALPNGKVHVGDTSLIRLSQGFVFMENMSFPMVGDDGSTVANARTSAVDGVLTLTYTDYVESHSDITGRIDAAIKADKNTIGDYGPKELVITSGTSTVSAGTVMYNKYQENLGEDLMKYGITSFDDNSINYVVRVNAAGTEKTNVTLKDEISTYGLTYDASSFKVTKGRWVIGSDDRWNLVDTVDVTDNFAPQIVGNSVGGAPAFTISFGDIGTAGYMVTYKANSNHTPVNAELFKNTVALLANDGQVNSVYEHTFKWESADGVANGYDYSINIHKTDASGAPLEGAVFVVTRDASGEQVGTITTDSSGHASLSRLLRDAYTITETVAPAGYKKAAPVHVSAEDLRNEEKTANVTVVDEAEQPGPTSAPTPSETSTPEAVAPQTPGSDPSRTPDPDRPAPSSDFLARTGVDVAAPFLGGALAAVAGAALLAGRRRAAARD